MTDKKKAGKATGDYARDPTYRQPLPEPMSEEQRQRIYAAAAPRDRKPLTPQDERARAKANAIGNGNGQPMAFPRCCGKACACDYSCMREAGHPDAGDDAGTGRGRDRCDCRETHGHHLRMIAMQRTPAGQKWRDENEAEKARLAALERIAAALELLGKGPR